MKTNQKTLNKRIAIFSVLLLGVLTIIFVYFKSREKSGLELDLSEENIVYGSFKCSGGVATLFVENMGTETIYKSSLRCEAITNPCTGTCAFVDLPPQETQAINISGCSKGGHTYLFYKTSPDDLYQSNIHTFSVYCS
jgi:hypothetical protein